MQHSTRLFAILPVAPTLAVAAAPAVTCIHDDVQMAFPTFGAMVLHMQQHHR